MPMATCSRVILAVFVLVWQCTLSNTRPVNGYRPVILMHGILAGPTSMTQMVGFIKDAHPDTDVYTVDLYDDFDSLVKMWDQVKGVYNKIRPILDNATDGVNLVCFSQGGLVCRGILEMFSVPNIHTFVSLSSPQAGQFGDTDYLKYLFPNFGKDHLYIIFYTTLGQDTSVANYWNDPHHQDLYQEKSNFLPFLNNGSNPNYKTNFLNVKQLVLIGGPNDGVIQPWESSHFAFYDENENVVPMTSQDFYMQDSFGLKTLDQSDRIKTYNIPGVEHTLWHRNQTVFDCCIEPWLT